MILSAQHVSYSYSRTARVRSDAVYAVADVSVSIAPGAFTGLLGPNGCGKTTLLRLLSGALSPDEGNVLLNGTPLTAFTRRAIAKQIAVVPQETHPAFDYTALEMVLMGRHPHLGAFELEGPSDIEIARDALAATGTAPLERRNYMTLSGGEKQRVIIASALAQEPTLLLLDEPTAALDVGYQLEIAALLTHLNRDRGVTMAIATHDLNLAASVCDTLVMMRGGRVVAHGPTNEVLTAANIRLLYDVDADVRLHESTGHLTVVPVGRTR